MSNVKLVREKARLSARSEYMRDFAMQRQLDFSAPAVGLLDPHNFVYLRRGEDKTASNVMHGTLHGWGVKIFDYSHTAAPDYYVEHLHTLGVLTPPADAPRLPVAVITPENYLERYLVEMQEAKWDVLAETGYLYRVFAQGEPAPALALARHIAPFLKQHPGIYVESRGNALLVFCPTLELAMAKDLTGVFELVNLLTAQTD